MIGHYDKPMPRTELLEYATLLRTIGRKVEEVGKNRKQILADLEESFDRPLDEDDLEIVDSFLAGL
jgi:hypothetical protein